MNPFSFTGRITRSAYWTVMIALTLLVGIFFSSFPFAIMYVGLAPLAVFQSIRDFSTMPMIPGDTDKSALTALILGIPLLIIFFCNLATTAKRFHDRGKSGWWAVILFVPFIGQLWAYIECGFLPGTVGVNAYGEDPQKTLNQKQAVAEPLPVVTSAPAPQIITEPPVEQKPPVMNGGVEQSPISLESQKPEDKKSAITEPLLKEVKENPSLVLDAKPGVPNTTIVEHANTPVSPITSELKDVKVPTEPVTVEGQTMLAHKSMEQMLTELAEINKKAEEAKKIHPKIEESTSATVSASTSATGEKKLEDTTLKKSVEAPGTIIMEEVPVPKTKDDLSSTLNSILASSDLKDEEEVKTSEKTSGTANI